MKLMIDIDIPRPGATIAYDDHLLLIGSCFTTNVGKTLKDDRFSVVFNPTGIVFDPLSAARHIDDMMNGRNYSAADLFELNGLWSSWAHHSEFSSVSRDEALASINAAVAKGNAALKKSTWLMITLGTSFIYSLSKERMPVTNCHKAPRGWFDKRMLDAGEAYDALHPLLQKLFAMNEKMNVVLTVSPVRHIRDGVAENNRSKARLIEAVHRLAEDHDRCHYFPAYELVIDVLRDYRFYEEDLVHPNHLATQYVFDSFCANYMSDQTRSLVNEVRRITTARQHRPLHPSTGQHKQFLDTYLEKVKEMQVKLPMIDWSSELDYFSNRPV